MWAMQPAMQLHAPEPLLRRSSRHRSTQLPRPSHFLRVARKANEFSSAEIVIAASAGIVTWVATGGNPSTLLGMGAERSLKRPDMAEKEVQMARQMFFRAAENYSDARESTGALLNRMAPEIVQAAKQRLEGAIKTLQESWQERSLAQGEQVRAYLVPDYLRNAKEKACMIAVAGNQSVGKSSFVRSLLGYEQVTAPPTTTEPVPYLYPLESDEVPCMLWDLPPLGAAGYPADLYMALMGMRHFDLVVVMMDSKFSETELLLLEELKYWKVPYVCVRNKLDVDVEREYKNEQLVWDNRGVKTGLDENVKADILGETLSSIRADLADLCDVARVYCVSTRGEYRQTFDWPDLMEDLRKFIFARCLGEDANAELEALAP